MPIEKLLPIVAVFLAAAALRRFNILGAEDGGRLLKLIFYITVPALYFSSIATAQLSGELLIFPLLPVVIVSFGFVIGSLIATRLKLNMAKRGVFLVAIMTANSGFVLPFVFAAYGHEGIVRLSLFDISNAILTFTVIYTVAVIHGNRAKSHQQVATKLIASIPLWAIILGLVVNLLNLLPPDFVLKTLETVGNSSGFLIMLALGLLLNFQRVDLKVSGSAISLRMLLGLVIGLIISGLLGLSGIDRAILLALMAAPVGYNTIIFSSLENLDRELAASTVSLSLLIYLTFIPLLLYVFA